MLTLVNFWNPLESLKYGAMSLILLLEGAVYWLVAKLFGAFHSLAGAEIFNDAIYTEFANKIYVLLGVITLFILAYSILKSMINLEELKKTSKLPMTIITSLVLLGLIPTIFEQAYKLQNILIESNIIGNVFFGAPTGVAHGTYTINGVEYTFDTPEVERATNMIVFDFMHAFSNPEDVPINSAGSRALLGEGTDWEDFTTYVQYTGDFSRIAVYTEAFMDGEAEYHPFVGILCGGFLIYVLISFCLDLGIRAVKLAFYHLIAPLPIMLRILPFKKNVFDNWVKATLTTFAEVFTRIIIIYMAVYLCQNIVSYLDIQGNLFIKIVICMGIFAFAKQAPKLISDITGLDSGNIKLGIRDKLAAGGAFGLAALIGGAATAGVRNFAHGIGKVKDAKGFNNRFRAVGSMLRSGAAGAVSGAWRSGKAGFNSKNFTDAKNAASTGARGAVEKRDKRENYRSEHNDSTWGVATGHVKDAASDVVEWATGNKDRLEKDMKKYNAFTESNKKTTDLAKAIMEKKKHNADIICSDFWDASNTSKNKGLSSQFRGMSMDAIKEYIETFKNQGVDREQFMTSVTDKITGKTTKTFDEASYQAALLNHAKELSKYQEMYSNLEKSTINNIKNHALNKDGIWLDSSGSSIVDATKLIEIQNSMQDTKDIIQKNGISSLPLDLEPGIDVADQLSKISEKVDQEKQKIIVQYNKMQRAQEARGKKDK